jgi:predicted PurR-regulated permease PerM
MFDEIKKELTSFKLLSVLLTMALCFYIFGLGWNLLSSFSDVVVILLFSWLLSFIVEPMVHKISRITRLSLGVSTLMTYSLLIVALALIVVLFIPVVSYQFEALSIIVPNYLNTAPLFIQKWSENVLNSLYGYVVLIPSIASFLFSLLLISIISFYFIVDKKRISHEFYDLIPQKWHDDLIFVRKIVNDTFSSFIQVQLLFGIVNGFATWLVLRIFGIDFAASVGLLAGIFSIIPVVGPIFAIIPPVFVSLIEDPAKTIAVFIILLLLQQLIFNIWGPKLLGKTFKIHPIIVFLSFLIGLKIAGMVGAIFAIPVVSILSLIVREISRYYKLPKEKRHQP